MAADDDAFGAQKVEGARHGANWSPEAGRELADSGQTVALDKVSALNVLADRVGDVAIGGLRHVFRISVSVANTSVVFRTNIVYLVRADEGGNKVDWKWLAIGAGPWWGFSLRRLLSGA
ncbi:hypothetical protein Rhe02_70950 [Rhizocola hellebori]|uniref:Uncharacterized protein n=1 Tax=Rhizocola hellebori TaxID=1392758 RepID=A0A8J3VKG8_9ACTN|nr:hypothetical protein Rhe02_70950 [Rhizocola hellebori]